MKLLLLAIALLVVAPHTVIADALPAPTLELVTAGTGAKKPLRFAPVKGTKRTIVMTSQQATARGLKGKLPAPETAPAVRSTIEVEVVDVTGDDIRLRFVYKNAEVVPDKSSNPEHVKMLASALSSFVGLAGTCVVTKRGITKEVTIDPPASATPALRTALDTAKSVATQIAQPLPDEAIAVGAKWKTTATQTAGEVTASTTTAYELLASTATTVKLRISTNVDGKGSGPGNLTTVTTARGETTIDLVGIVPSASKLDLRTEVGLDVDGKRLAQLVTTKTTLTSK